jgi:hypothetical protein
MTGKPFHCARGKHLAKARERRSVGSSLAGPATKVAFEDGYLVAEDHQSHVFPASQRPNEAASEMNRQS